LYYFGYRFYDPSLQRWLSPDPIGELGFTLLTTGRQPAHGHDFDEDEESTARRSQHEPEKLNLYGFVRNDPQNRVDALGLISFKNCDAKHQADIQSAWDSMCAMVNDPKYQCCINRSGLTQLLKRRCSWGNVKFTCKQGDANSPCGHSLWSLGIGRGSVVLYENAYDVSRCGQLKCTLVHEMTHILAGTPFEGGIVGKADSCCEQF
jgi:hypothetical protein